MIALSLILSLVHYAYAVTQSANVLYIESTPEPTTVNPQIVQFNRILDLNEIDSAIKVLQQYEENYERYCNQVNQGGTTKTYIKSIFENYDRAWMKCVSLGGKIVEIRTIHELQQIVEMMEHMDAATIWAGVTEGGQNNRTPVYVSDQSEVPYSVGPQGLVMQYNMYRRINQTLILQAVVGGKDEDHASICEKRTAEMPVLNVMNIACNRDKLQIKRTNKNIQDEFENFKHPNEMFHRADKRFSPVPEIKKDGTWDFMLPTHWIGSAVAKIFGLATQEDINIVHMMMSKSTEAINKISVNQKAIRDAIILVNDDIADINKRISLSKWTLTAVYTELDNKINIYNLQQLTQNTISKLIMAVNAATNGVTSPYVFGQADLNKLAAAYRLNNIPLKNDIDAIMPAVAISNSTWIFLFKVPVELRANEFRFYNIYTLPIFRNDLKFRTAVNTKYIAINMYNNEYFIPDADEYHACTTKKYCLVSAPFRKITDNSPCAINAYRNIFTTCQTVPYYEDLEPAFITFGNRTYYSTNNVTTLLISCPYKTNREQQTIQGLGTFEIPQECQATISNFVSIRPSFTVHEINLEPNSLFEPIRRHDIPLPFPIIDDIANITARPPPLLNDVSSLIADIQHTLSVNSMLRTGAQVFIIFLIILVFFLFLYGCCPNFRLWVNGCCFFTKPTVYWRKVKGYNVPPFTREKQTTDLERNDNIYASIKPKLKPILKMPTKVTLSELPPLPPPPPMPLLNMKKPSAPSMDTTLDAKVAIDDLYEMNKKLESYRDRIRSPDEIEIINETTENPKNLYPIIHKP